MREWHGIRGFFFFNDTATTEIYTLSLHDALPISAVHVRLFRRAVLGEAGTVDQAVVARIRRQRSEEHTSELQSQSNLVCRLLLEKKKNKANINDTYVRGSFPGHSLTLDPLFSHSL